MKVEELTQYGKALDINKKVIKRQQKIFLRILNKELGYLDVLLVMLNARKHIKNIGKEYPNVLSNTKKMGKNMRYYVLKIAGIFNALADKRGKNKAYEIMKRILQNIASVSMPAIYQLDDLIKCEGDIFDNYKKYNRAMFTQMNHLGICKNNGIHETKNLLEIKIISCIFIDFYKAIGCPEMAKLFCDHYLTGYLLIEEATQCEFRRFCALARGGDYCYFHFLRKGTAFKGKIRLKDDFFNNRE